MKYQKPEHNASLTSALFSTTNINGQRGEPFDIFFIIEYRERAFKKNHCARYGREQATPHCSTVDVCTKAFSVLCRTKSYHKLFSHIQNSTFPWWFTSRLHHCHCYQLLSPIIPFHRWDSNVEVQALSSRVSIKPTINLGPLGSFTISRTKQRTNLFRTGRKDTTASAAPVDDAPPPYSEEGESYSNISSGRDYSSVSSTSIRTFYDTYNSALLEYYKENTIHKV